jgi:hypothetical protein
MSSDSDARQQRSAPKLMQETDKIVKAQITPLPQSLSDPLPEVWITLEYGGEEKLFDYYPDEISFRADEFIGLTVAAARRIKIEKDSAYLRS